MDERDHTEEAFTSAVEEDGANRHAPPKPQTQSASFRLAYADTEFLLRDELRAVRLQLELLKPELIQREHGIQGTVVVFGSARIPAHGEAMQRLARAEARARQSPQDAGLARRVAIARRIVAKTRYYEEARRLTALIATEQGWPGCERLAVITGGGPGIMEAANRGAFEAGGNSVGLNIVLPREQWPNDFVTPELSFRFHYFAIRKMHFLLRARALVACPGGFGTLDELFETLTLIQTGKVKPVPVLLFGREYWERVVDFDAMVEEGTIDATDLELFSYVESAEEAWAAIRAFHDGGG